MPIPLELDPALCEEVALAHVLSEERAGRVHPYRRASEEVYRLPSGGERDRRFRELAMQTFAALPTAAAFQTLVAEFEPRFPGVTRVVVQRAVSRGAEGAELHVAPQGRVVRTEVTVERACAPTPLAEFLRQEWTHVADMLDAQFRYDPEELERAGATPFERRLVRERYRSLWAASVSGRLAREGKAPAGVEPRRREELVRAYLKSPEAARSRCFAELWNGPRPTHATLLALALDPRSLTERYAPESAEERGSRIPGDPCPLCGFPTWSWGDAAGLPRATHEVLTKDFPSWTEESGLCGRCEELYRAMTGCW